MYVSYYLINIDQIKTNCTYMLGLELSENSI